MLSLKGLSWAQKKIALGVERLRGEVERVISMEVGEVASEIKRPPIHSRHFITSPHQINSKELKLGD